MASYKELIEQRAALEQAIAAARQAEITGAVNQVKGLVREFDLTVEDIFGSSGSASKARSAKTSSKVAAKYRDPVTGATWTGRGREPRWIQGNNRESFAIGA